MDLDITPALLVDRDILDRNIARMAQSAASRGLSLRPHAKTHKCSEIGRRQLGAGARGLTVATVSEAEVFADEGFDDLFVAYPLWVDAARGARLRALTDRVRLTVGIDSATGARQFVEHAGTAIGVLVEIDSGHHRTGVLPEQAGTVASAAREAGLDVRGVFTFPGHSYAPDAPDSAAREEADALAAAAASLRAAGIEPTVISGGSSPTAHLDVPTVATELRPGVYVFGDAQQLELGAVSESDIALTALATVVSARDEVIVLDAGSKALGADRAAWATGYGRILGEPDARITALSEHHATVQWPEASTRPQLGDRVRVIPNHVCNAVNLADELITVSGDAVVERWKVAARGCNT
ncbi:MULTISPECIES: alanine racemase [Rhodococcus]|uniref:alanine racemase n=1 Tax=Rhodococcus TaxID=1827 RepID=UPI0005752E3D|nr:MULTISPECIES: alanine racemase [Rhodococcus]KHJ73016.1 alanine racemase [Rhodococcus sp. Chr-9]MBX4169774.1 alanine racemase [Rhodococcus sp. DMU2021]SEC17432.1 D-serine deaminase, pyridoxal phosphate-dependent [Rhodococcus pyridinivorans]